MKLKEKKMKNLFSVNKRKFMDKFDVLMFIMVILFIAAIITYSILITLYVLIN